MLEVATGSEKNQFFDQMFFNILVFKNRAPQNWTFKENIIFEKSGTVVSKNYFKVVINIGLYFQKKQTNLLRLKGANFITGRSLLVFIIF